MSRRGWILTALGLASIVVLGMLAITATARLRTDHRPTTPTRTTDTRSAALADDTAKRAFLGQYLTLKSAVTATEFHIVYHDNSTGVVPGPSDWDIQVALKVAPTDVSRWTAGMQPATANADNLAWGYALVPDEPRWKTRSQPQIYTAGGKLVAAFAREGIVLLRLQTNS